MQWRRQTPRKSWVAEESPWGFWAFFLAQATLQGPLMGSLLTL